MQNMVQLKPKFNYVIIILVVTKEYGIQGRKNGPDPLYIMIIHALQTVLHLKKSVLKVVF